MQNISRPQWPDGERTIEMTPQLNQRTESFVVRIWLEPREIANAQVEWRGVIEHVASGKRQYVLDLDTIVIFMAEYMQEWGVKPRSWLIARERIRRLITTCLRKLAGSS